MAIPVYLTDADKGYAAHVSEHGGQSVYQEIPPLAYPLTANRQRFFRQYLTADGTRGGNSAMNVNGATTSQEFYIGASSDYDIRITTIVLIIADTAVAHNTFGNVTALSVGFDLSVFESGEDTFLIEKAKTGGQVLAQSGMMIPYGDGVLSNELSNWTGNTDAQTITFPASTFVPDGLRLGRGNLDKIKATVNDDLTGLTEFTCLCLGYRVYP